MKKTDSAIESNSSVFGYLTLVFIVLFFATIGFFMNYHADDISFALYFQEHTGLNSIWLRIKESYFYDNGRFGQYLSFVYYYFAGLKSPFYTLLLPLWQLCNLFLFFTFIYARCFRISYIKDVCAFFLLFLLFVLGTNCGGAIFWVAGAFNHSFILVLLFSFLLPFRFLLKNENMNFGIVKTILFLLVAFCAGINYETLGLTVPLFCTVCVIKYFKNSQDKKNLLLFILGILVYIIGFILLVNNPGTHTRALREGHVNLMSFKTLFIDLLINGYLGHSYANILFFTLCLFMLFYFIINRKKINKQQNTLYFNRFFTIAFFVVLTVFPMLFSSTRSIIQGNGYFMASIISIMGIIYFFTYFPYLFITKKLSAKFLPCVVTLGVCMCFFLMVSYERVYNVTKQGFAILNNNKGKNTDVSIPIINKDAIFFPIQIYFMSSMQYNPDDFWNKLVAKMYGVKSVTGIPTKL